MDQPRRELVWRWAKITGCLLILSTCVCLGLHPLQRWRVERLIGAVCAEADLQLPWPGGRCVNASDAQAIREGIATASAYIESQTRSGNCDERCLRMQAKVACLAGSSEECVRSARLAYLLGADPRTSLLHWAIAVARKGRKDGGNTFSQLAALEALLQLAEENELPPEGWAAVGFMAARFPAPNAAREAWATALRGGYAAPVWPADRQRNEELLARRQHRLAQQAKSRTMAALAASALPLPPLNQLMESVLQEPDPNLRRAVAARWNKEKRDGFLASFVESPHSEAGNATLFAAIQASDRGEYASSLDSSRAAAAHFQRSGNQSGTLLAALYLAGGLRRSGDLPGCREHAENARRLASARGYRWLDIRLAATAHSCEVAQRASPLLEKRKHLYHRQRTSGYEDLELSGQTEAIQPLEAAAAPKQAWDTSRTGLQTFWQSDLPGQFAVAFYVPMGLSAAQHGYRRVAKMLFEEALQSSSDSPNHWLRDAIRRDFKRIDPAASLSSGQSANDPLDEAARLLEKGRWNDALPSLQRLANPSDFPNDSLEVEQWLRIMPLLADAYRAARQPALAARYDEAVVQKARQRMIAAQNLPQRTNYLRETEKSWRRYVRFLTESGNGEGALRCWQEFASVGSAQRWNLPPQGEAELWIANLGGPAVVWLADSRGVSMHRTSSDWTPRLPRRFAELASMELLPNDALTPIGRRLYREVLGPFEQRLEGVHSLTIFGDSDFGTIPWEALVDDNGRYLVERFAVTQGIASMARATAGKPEPIGWRPALLVGNPWVPERERDRFPLLPDATSELTAIATFIDRPQILEQKAARKSTILQALAGSRLFHFAGHAVATGAGAGLVAGAEDGQSLDILNTQDLAGQLSGTLRLVVLSACSTADGMDTGISNSDSLVQGFLLAGARTVVAARWPMDSRLSAKWMRQFYQELYLGKTPAQALRTAQRVLLAERDSSHPVHWAGFAVFESLAK